MVTELQPARCTPCEVANLSHFTIYSYHQEADRNNRGHRLPTLEYSIQRYRVEYPNSGVSIHSESTCRHFFIGCLT